MVLSEVWAKGGEGGVKLAEEVVRPPASSRMISHIPMSWKELQLRKN